MMSDHDDGPQGFYENLFKSTAKVNIKSYFQQYSNELRQLTSKERSIKGYMDADIDDAKFKILSEYCSIDKLTVSGEMEKRTTHRMTWRKEVFDSEPVPEDVNLQTIAEVKKRKKIKKELKKFKYRGETPIQYEKVKDKKALRATPNKNILVYVRVYNPCKAQSSKIGTKSSRIYIDSVIALRGEQSLADLRDKIACLSDYDVLKDVSKNPFQQSSGPSAKEIYPSGFFFIEDTFYNDHRSLNCKDNSKVIRDWGDETYGPFKTAFMENTRVDSLTVRFGFPWVYQHQGRCEHIIMFSDARLFSYDDELALSVYPRITRTRFQPVRYCMTCGIYAARWITVEHDRLPHNPCFFCNRCFKSYNYVDGRKLGNFKAFPYPIDKKLLQLVDSDTGRKPARVSKVSKK